MIFTIAQLREYARSVDKRLEDTAKYSDTWIENRIEEGFAVAQDIKQVFFTKEKYSLEQNIVVDLLTEVEIILQKEPHSVLSVECDLNSFEVNITANNHIIISRIPDTPIPTDFEVIVRYYFYPTLPLTNIEMTMEMWKLVKDGIAVVLFQYLRDKESEQYHQAKAESYIVKSTFDLDKELLNIPQDRLWKSSWV